MQYRLGKFRGSSVALMPDMMDLLSAGVAGMDERGAQERLLLMIERMSDISGPGRNQPCLLESLPADSPDRAWLEPTLEALEQAQAQGAGISLLACEAEQGPSAPFVVAAVALRRHAPARKGDLVCAGFALRRRPDAGVELFPRLYRVACANGSIRHAGSYMAGELEPARVRAEVLDLLGRRALDSEVERLRAAAAEPVQDPAELLMAAASEAIRARARAIYERQADRSYWGLINAITSAARNQRDWSQRLDEERGAGGLLTRLEGLPPQRPVGVALQPPASSEHLAAHA
jgi:hypothetical protein